jgi:hypothetical protein
LRVVSLQSLLVVETIHSLVPKRVANDDKEETRRHSPDALEREEAFGQFGDYPANDEALA